MAWRAYGRTVPRPPAALRLWLRLLRSAVFLLLVLAVAGPVFSFLRTEHLPAELLVVIEDSGSMAIGDNPPTGGAAVEEAETRWERALAWGAALDSAFTSLDPPVKVVFLRGNGLEPVNEFRLDDPVIPPPTNHGTDLEELLRKSADRMAGRAVRGEVLISDGQETGGEAAVAGSAGAVGSVALRGSVPDLGANGLTVIGVGDPRGTSDRIIKDLRFPDTAYEGDTVEVEFAVDHRFADLATGSSLQARVTGDGVVMADTTVQVTGRVVPVVLSFKLEVPGLQVFRLEVSALDNERFLDNNQASLAIDVRKERARILLLTGAPGWDVRFLAQAALSEERLRLDVVYPTPSGLVLADSFTTWTPPLKAEGWEVWDGVVISDWTGALTGLDWESLRQAVAGGLGLLVVPGPGTPGQPGPAAPKGELAGLLPVDSGGWRWTGGPLFVAPDQMQAGHPILEGLQSGGEGPAGLPLASLPPLEMMVETRAKSGAQVLLTGHRRDRTAPGDYPLLVVDRFEAGRVAWFGGRNLWELVFWNTGGGVARQETGEGSGRRLLRNLLVWTGSGEENSGLVFTGRQSFFQEGEKIRLGAQWRDIRGLPVLDRKLSLRLRARGAGSDTSGERTFALQRTDPSSGYAEVVLPPLPPGPYSVQLVGQGDPPVMGPVESLVVSGHSLESTQVRMDRRRLAQLAARGKGRLYAAGGGEAEVDLLPDIMKDLLSRDWTGEKISRRNRFDFWSGWPFLILITMLLAVEWFLRRRNGLL